MNEGRDDLMIYKMEDLFLFIRNGANIKQGKKDGFPITRIETISDRVVDRKKMGYADIYDVEKYEGYILQNEDILMSHINSVKHLGKSALFTRKFPEEVVIHGMNLLCLRANKDLILPKYAFYFFNSTLFTKLLMRYVKPSVNQASFAIRDFKKIEINIPSLSIQKKVVDVLDRLNKALNLRKEQIEALSALKQSVFIDMFGDPFKNPNNYPLQKLDEVCINILGGGTPSKRKPEYYIGDIPWVTPKDMKAETILETTDYINDIAIENSSAKLIPQKSLLMVIRSGILKHTLPISINKVDVTINQDMKAFVVDESKLLVEYLFFYFKCMENRILSKVRAVTAHNIEFKELLKSKVPLPDLNLQNQFCTKVKNIDRNMDLLNESFRELTSLYDSLLHKAFNGELFKDEVKA